MYSRCQSGGEQLAALSRIDAITRVTMRLAFLRILWPFDNHQLRANPRKFH
jgi:hypothetical protein